MNDTITLGNAIGWLLVVVGFVLTALFNSRTVRRQSEEDVRRIVTEAKAAIEAEFDTKLAGHDDRLDKIELAQATHGEKIADFMPRREIEGKFEIIQRGAIQAQEAWVRAFERVTDGLGKVQIEVATMRERHEGLAGGMAELKTLVKELGVEVRAAIGGRS